MIKHGEIDEGMTYAYQLFEEIIADTKFNKHLESYIKNFSPQQDDRFVHVAGQVFEMVLMDKIKMRRLETSMEKFLKTLEEIVEEIEEI
jgi:hypothetical protein